MTIREAKDYLLLARVMHKHRALRSVGISDVNDNDREFDLAVLDTLIDTNASDELICKMFYDFRIRHGALRGGERFRNLLENALRKRVGLIEKIPIAIEKELRGNGAARK